MKPKNCPTYLSSFARVIAAFAVIGSTQVIQADTFTWSGGGANGNWNNAANWDALPVPAADTDLVFAGTSNPLTNNDFTPGTNGVPINDITFAPGAGAFTLGGAAIDWQPGGIILNDSSNLQTISQGLYLPGQRTFTTNADISVTGNITGAGSGGFTKNGAGTLLLTGTANNIQGGVTVNAGTLEFGGSASLKTTAGSYNGTVTIESGSTYRFSGTGGDYHFGPINAGSIGSGTIVKGGTGTLIIAPNINGGSFGGELQINGGQLSMLFSFMQDANLNNVISGSTEVNFGGGILYLRGKNTGISTQNFASTTVNPGFSRVTADAAITAETRLNLGTVTVNPGGTLRFDNLTAAGLPTYYVTSGGSITVPGADFARTRASIMYGTAGSTRWARVDSTGKLTTLEVSTLLPSSGGGTDAIHSISTANVTLTANVDSYGLILNSNAAGRIVTIPDTFAYSANGIIGIVANNSTIDATGTGKVIAGSEQNLVINLATAGPLVMNAPIADSLAGASSLTVASGGTGLLSLNGANTYTGNTYLSAGSVRAASATTIPGYASTGRVVFNGGTLIVPLGGSGWTIGEVDTLLANATANSGALGIDTGSGSITLPTALHLGNLGFTKSGANTLVLSETNSYSGATAINGGTLQLTPGADNRLPGGSALTVGLGTASGILDLNGTSQQFATFATAGTGTTNEITNTSPTAGVLTSTQSANSTYNGILSGNLALVKNGNGTLILGGATTSTYNGGTTVNGGILQINAAAKLGDVAGGLTLNGGTLQNNGNNNPITLLRTVTLGGTSTWGAIRAGFTNSNIIVNGKVTGTGQLRISNESSKVVLGNTTNDYSGGTAIGDLATGFVTASLATLQLGAAGVLPDSGVVSFNGGINNASVAVTATLDLNGFNETIGGLAVPSGNAVIDNNAATAATLTVATSTSDFTFPGVIKNTGGALGLTKTGGGTLTLTGANTATGDTNVSEGTLALVGGSHTSAITVQSGASLGFTLESPTTSTANVTFAGGSTVSVTGSATLPSYTLLTTTGTIGGTLPPSPVAGYDLVVEGGTTLKLNQIGGGGFSSWITGTFANGTVPGGQQGPNDDPDGDGISNLVEYAVAGQDPTVSNSQVGSFSGNLLSFNKRLDATGLTYAIQQSTDLGISDPWTEVPDGVNYVNDSGTISYQLPAGPPAKNFIRLQVID